VELSTHMDRAAGEAIGPDGLELRADEGLVLRTA